MCLIQLPVRDLCRAATQPAGLWVMLAWQVRQKADSELKGGQRAACVPRICGAAVCSMDSPTHPFFLPDEGTGPEPSSCLTSYVRDAVGRAQPISSCSSFQKAQGGAWTSHNQSAESRRGWAGMCLPAGFHQLSQQGRQKKLLRLPDPSADQDLGIGDSGRNDARRCHGAATFQVTFSLQRGQRNRCSCWHHSSMAAVLDPGKRPLPL